MSDILLSICISSYNHGDKCVQLVNSLLSVQDNRYDVVICDDCSDENTIRELKTLSDSRVKLIQNKINLGACKNWFKTIDSGTGQYILHVLDRDIVSINFLPVILDILDKNDVGGGYFGRSALFPVEGIEKRTNYAICKKGREAFLTMAGVPIHPTGFFIQKDIWKKGKYRKYFYQSDKYGIYPHSYVFGEIAVNYDMIYSPIPFFKFVYKGSNKISRFYEKNNKPCKEYWWLPENVIKTDNRLMFYLCKIADNCYKREFICLRYKNAINRATLAYKNVASDKQEMEHYGLNVKFISAWRLLQISVKYAIGYLYVLQKMEMDEKELRKTLKRIWGENLKAILKEARRKKTDKLLSLSNKNLLYFQIMIQWINVKQKYNNLSVYFKERRYKRIAIYGMGVIGQTLLAELRKSDVEVVYGIDKNSHIKYTEVEVFSLRDQLPPIDAVVVTVVEDFEMIQETLKEKVSGPIISLADLVYDI